MRLLDAQARITGMLLLPGGRLAPGVVELAAGEIVDVLPDATPSLRRATRRLPDTLRLREGDVLAPAFIDVHCHGAGGGDVLGGRFDLAARALLRHGVGAVVAAVAAAPLAATLAAGRTLAANQIADTSGRPDARAAQESFGQRATASPPAAQVLGLHLEGPAIAPARSAGHDPRAFTSPRSLGGEMGLGSGEASSAVASGSHQDVAQRLVRIVTLAPELDGGLALVAQLAAAGIVASVGHTDASADVCLAAYAAGARSTTHLLNGMAPLRPREPGAVGAALAAAPFIELITDGVHVDGALLAPLTRAIGDSRLVIVSDALPLAGSRLRRTTTPGSRACILHGRAVHPDGTLAGSRLLLDGMVAEAVRHGVPLALALRAVTENPAALLGLADRARLEPGRAGGLVVVDPQGRLRMVLQAGAMVLQAGAGSPP